jgi:hypothetical protein
MEPEYAARPAGPPMMTVAAPEPGSMVTRRTVLRTAGALGLISAFGVSRGALAAPAMAVGIDDEPVINTYTQFDGHQIVAPFGYPDTTTYGQTITIPPDLHSIYKVTLYLAGRADEGQKIVVRGEIYGWNGVHATTPVAESEKMTLSFDNSDFNEVKVKFSDAAVVPGEQYIAFVSVDPDYKEARGDYTVTMGAVSGNVYTGGGLFFQNNAGSEADWTTAPWTAIPGYDAAVKVFISA